MSEPIWYLAVDGRQEGPFRAEEIEEKIRAGAVARSAHVYREGLGNWAPVVSEPRFAAAFRTSIPRPPGSVADEIDYVIVGEEMQFVEITLDPGEACVAEAGSFMYMDPGIEMKTIFGDGSDRGGGGFMDKLMSAGKRVLTGESLFMTVFGNNSGGRRTVAFASPYPGRIIPLDLPSHNHTILCQKDAFLCAAKGVSVGIAFQRKLGAGLFGGEGFILQKLEGPRVRSRRRRRRRAGSGGWRNVAARYGLPGRIRTPGRLRHPDGERDQDRSIRWRGSLLRQSHRTRQGLDPVAPVQSPCEPDLRRGAADRWQAQRRGVGTRWAGQPRHGRLTNAPSAHRLR